MRIVELTEQSQKELLDLLSSRNPASYTGQQETVDAIIEAVRISSDKYLELVKIGQGYYVISVCKNNISLICKVPEEELILNTGESPEGEGQETAKKSFAEILTSLKDLGKR